MLVFTGHVAEVRSPEVRSATGTEPDKVSSQLTSPIHYGSPIITNSRLTFAYLIKGPSSLSVQAEMSEGANVVQLWSTTRLPMELDTRWSRAAMSIPETDSFAVSFICSVVIHSIALSFYWQALCQFYRESKMF